MPRPNLTGDVFAFFFENLQELIVSMESGSGSKVFFYLQIKHIHTCYTVLFWYIVMIGDSVTALEILKSVLGQQLNSSG